MLRCSKYNIIVDLMSIPERYQERYKAGDAPWDIGKPDFNLIEAVSQKPIAPCKALDIGCGTGDNSIWLAQNGFQVVGIDSSDIALGKAREKAIQAKVECDFKQLNFLISKVEGAPFGFVFDRGCFHSFASPGDRSIFAQNVAEHLSEDGFWLTLVGNADDRRESPGPPRRSAFEIVSAVEPYFEILSLISTHFGSNRPIPPRAWRCLMRKRSS